MHKEGMIYPLRDNEVLIRYIKITNSKTYEEDWDSFMLTIFINHDQTVS